MIFLKKESPSIDKGNNKGPSSHPHPGGNWPSKTKNRSGGGRGNAPKK